MSENRKIKRGKLTLLFNETFKRFEKYRLSSRGNWININNPNSEQISKEYMKKLQLIQESKL